MVVISLIALVGSGMLACQRTPDHAVLARELIEKREFGPALEALAAAVENDPSDPQIQLEYGRLLVRMRLWARSIWPLYRAANMEGFSGREEALTLLAESYTQTADQPDAIAAIETLIELDPENFQARSARARAYVRDHDEEPALEEIDWLLARDESHESELKLLELKLKALLQLERADEAQAVLDTIRAQVDAEEEPHRAARLCTLNATFAAERDRLDDASAAFEACLEQHSDSVAVVQKAIAFFDSQGETERSTEVLEEAVANSPGSVRLRKALALRFRALGRTEEAIQILEQGRDESPREVSILLAEHYMEVDDFPAALAAFEDGFSTESDEELFEMLPEEYRFMLGDILVLTHEEDRLRKLIEHLEEPAYRDFLEARMFQEQGDHLRALESFDSGLRLWPGSAGARFLAGQSASQLGDFDTAIDHYRNAIRTDAALSNAGLELARLYAASGSHSAAVAALNIHVKAHPGDAEALRRLADLHLALGQKARSSEARGALESMPGERDHAYADQARDLARYSTHQHALDFVAANVPNLLAPEFKDTLAVWCEIMRSAGQSDEALALLSSEEASTRSEQAYRDALRGQILWSESRVEEAEAAFLASLDTDPSEWRAALGQARLLVERGRTQEAIGFFDRVSVLVEDDPVALYESGVLLAFDAKPGRKEARRRLKEALVRQPTFGPAALTLAQIALVQGDESDEAVGFALRAARLLRSAESALVAAELQMARGEARQAIESIEWVIESGRAEGGEVNYLLARALLMAGDEERERARAALEDALEYEPFIGSDEAREQLSRLGGDKANVGSG